MGKSSLMKRYLFLLVLALAAVCILIGMFFLNHALGQLYLAQETSVQKSMELTMDAFVHEYDSMHQVSLDIMHTVDYAPFYLRQNKVNEIGMLKDFTKMSNRLNGIHSYFIIYRDEPEWVYASDGRKSTLPIYLRTHFRIAGSDELHAAVLGASDFTILRGGNAEQLIYYIYPLRFFTGVSVEPRASLVFVLPESRFQSIYSSYLGQLDARFSLSAGGAVLAGDLEPSAEGGIPGHTHLTVKSYDGAFELDVSYNPTNQYNTARYLSSVGTLFPIVIVLVILAVGALLSYLLIKPLRDLIRRFDAPGSRPSNEITQIEQILKREIDRGNVTSYQLKNQLFLQLLEGNTSPGDDLSAFFHIDLTGSTLCIIIIDRYQAQSDREFASLVEEMSEEGMVLYCVRLSADRYAVIADIENGGRADEVLDLIESLVEEGAAGIYPGLPVEGVENLNASYLSLINEVDAGNEVKDRMREDDAIYQNLMERNNHHYLEIIKHIGAGDERGAVRALDGSVSELRDNVATLFLERYLCFDMLKRMVEYLDTRNSALPDRRVLESLTFRSVREYRQGMIRLIGVACSAAAGDDRASNLAEAIIAYIDENSGTPELSLDMIGSHFGISANYVGVLVKGKTGIPYKNYLTGIRIERAKYLLVERRLSVAETSIAVGYRRASNFIKKFKELTGYTPLRYLRHDEDNEV